MKLTATRSEVTRGALPENAAALGSQDALGSSFAEMLAFAGDDVPASQASSPSPSTSLSSSSSSSSAQQAPASGKATGASSKPLKNDKTGGGPSGTHRQQDASRSSMRKEPKAGAASSYVVGSGKGGATRKGRTSQVVEEQGSSQGQAAAPTREPSPARAAESQGHPDAPARALVLEPALARAAADDLAATEGVADVAGHTVFASVVVFESASNRGAPRAPSAPPGATASSRARPSEEVVSAPTTAPAPGSPVSPRAMAPAPVPSVSASRSRAQAPATIDVLGSDEPAAAHPSATDAGATVHAAATVRARATVYGSTTVVPPVVPAVVPATSRPVQSSPRGDARPNPRASLAAHASTAAYESSAAKATLESHESVVAHSSSAAFRSVQALGSTAPSGSVAAHGSTPAHRSLATDGASSTRQSFAARVSSAPSSSLTSTVPLASGFGVASRVVSVALDAVPSPDAVAERWAHGPPSKAAAPTAYGALDASASTETQEALAALGSLGTQVSLAVHASSAARISSGPSASLIQAGPSPRGSRLALPLTSVAFAPPSSLEAPATPESFAARPSSAQPSFAVLHGSRTAPAARVVLASRATESSHASPAGSAAHASPVSPPPFAAHASLAAHDSPAAPAAIIPSSASPADRAPSPVASEHPRQEATKEVFLGSPRFEGMTSRTARVSYLPEESQLPRVSPPPEEAQLPHVSQPEAAVADVAGALAAAKQPSTFSDLDGPARAKDLPSAAAGIEAKRALGWGTSMRGATGAELPRDEDAVVSAPASSEVPRAEPRVAVAPKARAPSSTSVATTQSALFSELFPSDIPAAALAFPDRRGPSAVTPPWLPAHESPEPSVQLSSHPASQLASQPVSQPASQLGSQPVSQPRRQPSPEQPALQQSRPYAANAPAPGRGDSAGTPSSRGPVDLRVQGRAHRADDGGASFLAAKPAPSVVASSPPTEEYSSARRSTPAPSASPFGVAKRGRREPFAAEAEASDSWQPASSGALAPPEGDVPRPTPKAAPSPDSGPPFPLLAQSLLAQPVPGQALSAHPFAPERTAPPPLPVRASGARSHPASLPSSSRRLAETSQPSDLHPSFAAAPAPAVPELAMPAARSPSSPKSAAEESLPSSPPFVSGVGTSASNDKGEASSSSVARDRRATIADEVAPSLPRAVRRSLLEHGVHATGAARPVAPEAAAPLAAAVAAASFTAASLASAATELGAAFAPHRRVSVTTDETSSAVGSSSGGSPARAAEPASDEATKTSSASHEPWAPVLASHAARVELPKGARRVVETAPAAPAWALGDEAGVPIQGGISGASAHLALDLGHATTLGLHLRVKDGVADVRIEGAGSDRDLFRREEVVTALRQEGLSLGSWEVHSAVPDAPATLSHPRVTTLSGTEGTPLAKGTGETPMFQTSTIQEGARRASTERGATLVTPPASGRRFSAAERASRTDSSNLEQDERDDEQDPSEGLHVTA